MILVNLMNKKLFILLDFVFVIAAFVGVRSVMVMSPVFNTQAEQWNQLRYWITGFLAALVFIILSSINGFYKKLNEAELKKFPITNLINCVIVFGLGIVACFHYSSVFDSEQLLSKKILFLAVLAIYIFTTFIRYFIKRKN